MKLVDISEKKKEYLKAKIDECETIRKVKNIRDLYRGIKVHKVNDVRNTEIHKAEPPVPEPSNFEVDG